MNSGYWIHGDWPHVGNSNYVTQFWGFLDFSTAIHKSGPYNCKKLKIWKPKTVESLKKLNCLKIVNSN